MDAGKTLDLIKVSYNYNDRGQNTLVLTSSIDTRAGDNKVQSRTGFDLEATSTSTDDNLFEIAKLHLEKKPIACILVDEIHFFSIKQVEQLSDVVDFLNIPVICYGLRSDYRGQAFPTSAYLLAIADTIEELKTICHCGKKATFNMLVKNGIVDKEGSGILVDDDNLKQQNIYYVSVCRLHFKLGQYQTLKH
jgi:thymidine kinase